MTPSELSNFLARIVRDGVDLSIMIWGAPGIGKSSVVRQVAEHAEIDLIDLRLSQLAPTDLRGLPVPRGDVPAPAPWVPARTVVPGELHAASSGRRGCALRPARS